MSLEKAIQKLTNVIQAARMDFNTTPIEYGPDGRMRPAGKSIQGRCVTRRVSNQDESGQITSTPQCMCYYDNADGTRCIVRLTSGLCGDDEGPKTIPANMPCITS